MMTEKITSELGWITDQHSKEVLISDATNLLRDKRLGVYDEQTVGEMMSYVRDADGHANAAKSAYDDRVMAFLIGLRMLTRAKNINTGNEIEKSDEDMMGTGQGFYMDGNSFDARGMPSHPDSMNGGLGGDDLGI